MTTKQGQQDWSSSLVEEATEPATPFVLLESVGIPAPRQATLVGDCLDVRHPTLVGRVLLRLADGDAATERWTPVLQGLSIREGDRVLVIHASNFAEPVVVGVIDGFALRPRVPAEAGPSLELLRDEALRITTERGEPLVEIVRSDRGPVVRLLRPDVEIDLDGALCVSARSIELRARQGEVRVDASADVVVRGENIQLN